MEPNPLLILGVSGSELTADEADLIRSVQPGGFVLDSGTLPDIAQTRQLTDRLRALSEVEPLLILRSGHGGVWPSRLLDAPAPTPDRLRDQGDPKRIMTAGWIAGRLLRVLGFNFHLSPRLTIGGGWGDDDQEVINNGGTFNRYQRKQGILGCGFPFPGESSCADLDTAALLESPLLPYTALMPELDGLLLSDSVFPKLDPRSPASASTRIITRLLRDQLGYKRLVLAETGDANSITAGADLIILRDAHSAREALAMLEGLPGYLLADAGDRIEYARKRLHQPANPTSGVLDRLREDARALDDLL